MGNMRNRRLKRRLSGWLILALLFMQLASAGYACPLFESAKDPALTAAMPDCEETGKAGVMDPEQPLLCKASCEQDAQSFGTWAAADLSHSLALLYVVATVTTQSLHAHAQAGATPALAERPPGWPPLYLFNHILRN